MDKRVITTGIIVAAVIGIGGWYVGTHFDVVWALHFAWEGVKLVAKDIFFH